MGNINLSMLFSNIRRKNIWSAPAVMSAFLFICLIVIYSWESIGLSNRERNIDLSKERRVSKDISKANNIRVYSDVKEYKLQLMQQILIEGTHQQMLYTKDDLLSYYDTNSIA